MSDIAKALKAYRRFCYMTGVPTELADRAEAQLTAQQTALEAAREALNTISPDGWMQYLGEEECVTQCGGAPESGHVDGCKWLAATLEAS